MGPFNVLATGLAPLFPSPDLKSVCPKTASADDPLTAAFIELKRKIRLLPKSVISSIIDTSPDSQFKNSI